MLQDNDLQNFLEALKASDTPAVVPAQPSSTLRNADGIFPSEIWRLACSLQIAASAGDAPQLASHAAQIILDDIKGLQHCAPLSDLSRWVQAIAWARTQPPLTNPATVTVPPGRIREVIVGNACRRLRDRGYSITIGAHGPQVDISSRRQIVQSAENLVNLLGGLDTANQVIGFLNNAKLHHDGIWLFGETSLGFGAKQPMPPVGWLFSLGLRHLNCQGRAKKPAVAWKSLVELATDFAAVHDCQRYSQFEGLNLHATQIHRALADSILWREFFSLPQMPPKALRQVLDVLEGILTHEDEAKLGFAARPFFKELAKLLELSVDDRLTSHPRTALAQTLPLLHRLTGGARTVNIDYGDPLAMNARTQDGTLLFACGKDHVITLPRALLASAACQLIFTQIWEKLGKRAEDITKETLEHTIINACQSKAATVLGNKKYLVRKSRYEIDAATRDQDRIVLIETKGKSLTSQSRSGDIFSFFNDYSESFLRMLSQLVRHEVHLRHGLTPLTAAGEKVDDLRPMKVAVSPLSYGPISDKLLSSSLLRSFIGAKLNLITPNDKNQKIMDKLHERINRILQNTSLVAPQRNGVPDLTPYFIDVFWLDIGQLLYILDRANTVWDAFAPLKHITFNSRDFWTELANADRGELTKDKWKPAG